MKALTKALIFDGSYAGDPLSGKISAALQQHLPGAETVVLRQQKIGNCAGDFFCWVRSPGMCNIADDNRLLAAKVMQSDLLVYLTPVTFGGYGVPLKRMVDHQIQNILPYFTSVNGEIHHQPRYRRYPKLLVVGWVPAGEEHPASEEHSASIDHSAPDAQAEAVFRHLVYRNAVNLYAQKSVCDVLVGEPSEAEILARSGDWLAALEGPKRGAPTLPAIPASPPGEPARRAILLVGSPRTRKSTSAALGNYLFGQLARRGVQTEVLQVYTEFSSTERKRRALEKLEAADLVVLAFPLYVDSLPAPVIAALESIAAKRMGRPTGQRLAAIANCGFPEASHNDTALAICAEFARQSGFAWAGGLALGGGEGIVHGTPLEQLDGRAIPIKKSLEIAADALAAGESIPSAASDLLAKPTVPSWLYRLFGAYGWRQQAGQYGARQRIKDRPYERVSSGK